MLSSKAIQWQPPDLNANFSMEPLLNGTNQHNENENDKKNKVTIEFTNG